MKNKREMENKLKYKHLLKLFNSADDYSQANNVLTPKEFSFNC